MEKQILNFENGLDMMGGDRDLYRELIEEFLRNEPYDGAHIQELVQSGKSAEAGSRIHRLKGAAAAIGCEALQDVCSRAERILRGKEDGDATPLLPLIVERYSLTIPALQNALVKLS